MSKVDSYLKLSSRKIGERIGLANEPTMVFLAGIHGNEHSGVFALKQVFSELKSKKIPTHGTILGLCGNLEALNQNTRYIDVDLNRAWTDERLNQFTHQFQFSERNEIEELKEILDQIIDEAKAPVSFVDLHSTSSVSSPFVVIDDTIRNRKMSEALPCVKVLGILEQLKGTILGYYGDKGPTTLVFEAGQHEAQSSIDRHVAAIWLLLVQRGIIDKKSINTKQYQDVLSRSGNSLPQFVECFYRLALSPEDEFEMKPNFANFTKVKQGQTVATLNGEQVIIPEDSYMFMPLYQSQGEDGFFLVKTIKQFWISTSEVVRRLGFDRLVQYLPGVSKSEEYARSYRINTSIASIRTLDVLHLFGYRYEQKEGNDLIVSKRPWDLKGPWAS